MLYDAQGKLFQKLLYLSTLIFRNHLKSFFLIKNFNLQYFSLNDKDMISFQALVIRLKKALYFFIILGGCSRVFFYLSFLYWIDWIIRSCYLYLLRHLNWKKKIIFYTFSFNFGLNEFFCQMFLYFFFQQIKIFLFWIHFLYWKFY